MRVSILTLGSVLTLASCTPVPDFVVHEKRGNLDSRWIASEVKLDRRTIIPVAIGLTQQNLHNGEEYLMDISDPTSPNYGKHWSAEKVAEVFAPTAETIDAVNTWLEGAGIGSDRVSISKSLSWIRFNSTIEEVESLLHAKYQVFEHVDTKKMHITCDEYSVPAAVKAHVDFITPTIGLDAYLNAREPRKTRRAPKEAIESRQGLDSQGPDNSKPISGVQLGSFFPLPRPVGVGPTPQLTPQTGPLDNCHAAITPNCLRALYGIPVGSTDLSSFGILEFTPQAYWQRDLDLFYESMASNVPAGTAPLMNSINGGTSNIRTNNVNTQAESDLDLEYAIALVHPQKVTLYQVGDGVTGATFNTFLDALDEIYCAGTKNMGDPVYPSTRNGGFTGQKSCGQFRATSVISISYANNEADLPSSYMSRQCSEYMKLGVQGVTLLVSSGDNGVAGNSNKCCTEPNCRAKGKYNLAGATGYFNPSFPSTCPWITSVGATEIAPNAKVTAPERACSRVIYSGGGFSNFFTMPAYQSTAVPNYNKKYSIPSISSRYNSNRQARGIPDISANGANYVCTIDEGGLLVYGTSASAPTFGSIITLINQERIKNGKGPVGFINPVLYANPKALNDISRGSNPGCGTDGFSAVAGWDPVTGLGTPSYPRLLKVFMALT